MHPGILNNGLGGKITIKSAVVRLICCFETSNTSRHFKTLIAGVWEATTAAAARKTSLRNRLRVLSLFHLRHVWNGKRVLSLNWHERFSCKGREWKLYYCRLTLSSEPQIWLFYTWLTDYVPKCLPHVQNDYFSSFSQSYHWLKASPLSLLWSFLKLLIVSVPLAARFQIRMVT